MTAHSTITRPNLTLVDADHTGEEVRRPEN
jgi:hypothetical protein